MAHKSNIVEALRQTVATIEGTQEKLVSTAKQGLLPLNIKEIDAIIKGGIALDELHEIRCSLSRDIGSACAFVFALLAGLEKRGMVVWIHDPSVRQDAGLVLPEGLRHFGFDAARILHVHPLHLKDALWAAGEAARAGHLASVVLHVRENPKLLDLAASRKLRLRAQTSRTPFFILRQAGQEEASSAATRWHVKPVQSEPHEIYLKGVGHMRLDLALEKNRNGETKTWTVAWNPSKRSFEHAAPTLPSTHPALPFLPSADRPHRTPAVGKIVDFEQAS